MARLVTERIVCDRCERVADEDAKGWGKVAAMAADGSRMIGQGTPTMPGHHEVCPGCLAALVSWYGAVDGQPPIPVPPPEPVKARPLMALDDRREAASMVEAAMRAMMIDVVGVLHEAHSSVPLEQVVPPACRFGERSTAVVNEIVDRFGLGVRKPRRLQT